MKNILKLAIVVFCTGVLVFSQTGSVLKKSEDVKRVGTAARYIFSPSTESFMMTVKIWGEVRNPGIYEVPIDLDLMDVISAAGGPTDRAKLTKVKLIRYEPKEGEDKVIEIDIKEYLKTGDKSMIPIVRSGDTVIVPMRPIEYVLRTLSWSQQVISIYYLGAMIQYYLSRSK